jgi:hypothetical protein
MSVFNKHEVEQIKATSTFREADETWTKALEALIQREEEFQAVLESSEQLKKI